jgi:hypothetical protein
MVRVKEYTQAFYPFYKPFIKTGRPWRGSLRGSARTGGMFFFLLLRDHKQLINDEFPLFRYVSVALRKTQTPTLPEFPMTKFIYQGLSISTVKG